MNGKLIMVLSKRLPKRFPDELIRGWLFEDNGVREAVISYRDHLFDAKEPDVILRAEPLIGTTEETIDKFCNLFYDIVKARQDHFAWLACQKGVVV